MTEMEDAPHWVVYRDSNACIIVIHFKWYVKEGNDLDHPFIATREISGTLELDVRATRSSQHPRQFIEQKVHDLIFEPVKDAIQKITKSDERIDTTKFELTLVEDVIKELS